MQETPVGKCNFSLKKYYMQCILCDLTNSIIRLRSYDEVLPYFLKSEKANLKGLSKSVYHNRDGLLDVQDVPYR